MRLLALILSFSLFGIEALANPVRTDNVRAELLSSQQNIKAGDEFYLGMELDLREHWHSYWINPGAAGLATNIRWQLPPGIKAGAIQWPTPKAIQLGKLINYGYEGKTLYPIPFVATADFDSSKPIDITASASWLVCEDICIPEQVELNLTLNQGALENPNDNARIQSALDKLPKQVLDDQIEAGFALKDGRIRFSFAGPLIANANISNEKLWFFPIDTGAVKHSVPQIASFGERGFTLWSDPGFRVKRGTLDKLAGVLVIGTGKSATAWQVNLQQNFLPKGAGAEQEPSNEAPKKTGSGGLILALFFAFIGGVLLNLMPCVFPVLSMKVMGFVSAAHAQAGIIRRHGLFFLVGVLISFLALGGLLLALKAGGQQIGWGFQLQYPPFVAAIAMLFFILGLNLLGVFSIGGRWMGIGESLTEGKGDIGAFFTGVLAVIVASPCTAPAMGWALGFTLTQSAPVSLSIFLFLGLGFAAPFTLLSFKPGLLKLLPKPGPWMQRFHQLMAFPMFGAALWLVWVLSGLSGSFATTAMLIAFLLVGFAFWAWKGKIFGKSAAVLAAIFAILMVANTLNTHDVSDLQPQVWSTEKVQQLRNEGKTVFVDFTADWCVTCQLNERTSLSGKRMAKVFEENNAVLLVADWTNRDDAITAELARFGRVGVPLYLVYRPGSLEPQILPQILTPKIVATALAGSG